MSDNVITSQCFYLWQEWCNMSQDESAMYPVFSSDKLKYDALARQIEEHIIIPMILPRAIMSGSSGSLMQESRNG